METESSLRSVHTHCLRQPGVMIVRGHTKFCRDGTLKSVRTSAINTYVMIEA